MAKQNYENHQLQPESLMMSFDYSPETMLGSVKTPLFQTSTFSFKTAEEGKAIFQIENGLAQGEKAMIYSRLNNPNADILEKRLALWEQSEACAVFESGMAAISTTLLAFLKPNDVLLYSNALYSGTNNFIRNILPQFGINLIEFGTNDTSLTISEKLEKSGMTKNLKMIYVETPSNPTNTLFDIGMCQEIANKFSTDEKNVLVIADNTYMGPLWQKPLALGADLVVYSATKYMAGHSDLLAGACMGTTANIQLIKSMRLFLGNIASPNTSWLLNRSLETMQLRMERQAENALQVADFLVRQHAKIEKLYFIGKIGEEQISQKNLHQKQHLGAGAMISFDIKGGEAEAFKFLNALKIFKIAVSLGSTESLAQHPETMTHSGVAENDRRKAGITDKMIRLSIGIENIQDLLWDLEQALAAV